jgi:Flp pilus assembly protein TadG
MKTKHPWTASVGNQRGSVLVLVVMSLVMLLGMAAMAIDTGIMYVARSEAQRAAEAGAHAGAGTFIQSPNDVGNARKEARTFAESNQVRWVDLDVLPGQDIDVITDSQKVRVRTYRSESRGNPITTLFAGILGIPTVDVAAHAAAQSWPGDATDCILPFAIPDNWWVNGPPLRDAQFGEVWDEARGDVYVPAASPAEDGSYSGYGVDRIGHRLQLTTADPSTTPQPEWYYAIRLPGSKGANDFKNSIMNCWLPAGDQELGDEMQKEPGNMEDPTREAFADIFNDPNERGAYWDDRCKCPRNANGDILSLSSRRIRPVPMFNPTDWVGIAQGAHPVPISGFAGIFMEEWDGNNTVMVRFMQYQAVKPAANWDGGNGSLVRILRIVE